MLLTAIDHRVTIRQKKYKKKKRRNEMRIEQANERHCSKPVQLNMEALRIKAAKEI